MKIELNKMYLPLIVLGLLVLIVYLNVWVRMGTLDSKTVLDYDPHWYYRHALEIMNNGGLPPKWDTLSYYPPGRPFDPTLGWEYAMILFYKIAQIFSNSISFLTVAKWSPLITVALGVISAFFTGRLISNNWGGLLTGFLAVLSPTFIGVSMAAYTDNDPIVVFYTFFVTLSILLALKKKTIQYISLAIVANALFAFTWTGGWLPSILFVFFLPALLVFRMLEQFVHTFKLKFNFGAIFSEIKEMAIPLAIIIISSNVIVGIFCFAEIFFHS